jgi:hypothetical protein
VTVKHPPGEKEGFTISLTVRADGGKFPAAIVFKGNRKTGELSERILSSLVVPGNVFVFSSTSAWWTEYLDNLWIKYTFPKSDDKKLLIRDQAPVHKLSSSQELFEERNVEQLFIPAGKTGVYQPLDVGVNRPFKAYYREEYEKWRLENSNVTRKGYLKKPSRQDFINMVSVAWERVSCDAVRNAFRAAQIIDKTCTELVPLAHTQYEDGEELECSFYSESMICFEELCDQKLF